MYTLHDFEMIHKRSVYTLSVEQKKIIHQLCKSLGVESNFSVMVQEKKTLQDCIRELNKLTDETKDVRVPIILDIVKMNEHDLTVFSETLLSIMCKNSFFVKTYADLFFQLQLKWDVFKTTFSRMYSEYVLSFDHIETCDPEKYDEYCALKKKNDERRAFSLFLVHLGKSIPPDSCINVVHVIIKHIEELIYVDKKECMNELVENLFMFRNIMNFPKDKISHFAALKPTIGLNYKILFRFMDILK
jgi:hypothetical protein